MVLLMAPPLKSVAFAFNCQLLKLIRELTKSLVVPTPAASTTSDVCAVCLDDPLHPVTLPCTHIFCFLCCKGLVEGGNNECSLCRQAIPFGFLKDKKLLQRTQSDLDSASAKTNQPQWFYEGKKGWWKFEKRCNEELEEYFQNQDQQVDMLICGNVYVIDFNQMVQYRKDIGGRRRKIMRDIVTGQQAHLVIKGVAGLVAKQSP